MRTICFDFGNTRLKYAVFNDDEMHVTKVLQDGNVNTIEDVLMRWQPDRTILSSVVNHDAALETLLAARTKFHKLSHTTKLPFTSPIGKPETIGADRLALASAAVFMSPQHCNLVIALGTCITYNFINKAHEFIGGSISPGMDMRFKSMQELTAKLPLVGEDWNFPVIGYDTTTNILSGVIMGMAKEIDGMINEYKDRYNYLDVMLTGGNARYFKAHLKNDITADPDLLFKGLYALSEINNK